MNGMVFLAVYTFCIFDGPVGEGEREKEKRGKEREGRGKRRLGRKRTGGKRKKRGGK